MDQLRNVAFRPLARGNESLLSTQPAQVPVKYEDRQTTDGKWLILFTIIMAIFIPFSIYVVATSNLSDMFHGGNNNINYPNNHYRNTRGAYSYRSGNDPNPQPPSQEFPIEWGKIVGMAFVTIALSLTVLLLYRYATAVIVWGILILCLVALGFVSVGFWVAYLNANENTKPIFSTIAVIITIVLFIFIIILMVCSKKIKLIIILYNETTKCIFDMPFLTTIPVVSFLIEAVFLALFYITMMWLTIGGNVVFAMFLNTFVALWLLQFILGCQYMAVAGAASTWYFARERRAPILTSLKVMFRYHLGTIALGSLILVLLIVIKGLLKSLTKSKAIKSCIESVMGTMERLFKFLSKNAYIETAIHAHGFITSGKRAATLLLDNLGNVLAINFVGDFVMAMCRVFIVAISVGISYAIFREDVSVSIEIGISAGVSLFIVLFFFGVFETVIDSLFICYCEDITLNDGITRPYLMSDNLRRFFDDTKSSYDNGTLPAISHA